MTREEYIKRKIYLKKQAIELLNDEIKLLRTELSQEQGPQKNQAAPQNTRPELVKMPIIGGEFYPIYGEDVAEWIETYPNVDVIQTLKVMVQWCKSNPKKLKTKRGVRKFITSWLTREQDKPNKPSKNNPYSLFDNRPRSFPKNMET